MNLKKLNVLNFFATLTLCALLLFCILPIHGESLIYGKVLRLHVVASSDSDLDQSLKLEVRDAVLEYAAPLLEGAADRDQAAAVLEGQKEEIEQIATARLRELGCDHKVSFDICKERYPTKSYESFCFPSGEYLSAKLTIGKAEGQNWWCLLFPQLCTAIAAPQEEFAAVGFTPEQYKIITESENATYKIRFRLLEFFEELSDG